MDSSKIVAANDLGAVHVTGWIFVAWAVIVATAYVLRVFAPCWHREGLGSCWKHAAVVLSICAMMGGLGALFLTLN